MNPRVACAKVIAAVLQQQISLTAALSKWTPRFSPRDRGLLQELCFGTLRWYPRLALILQQLLQKPLKSADADIQAVLASAIYQLTDMRVPAHAAVNEAVAACQVLKKPWARGLVNGVLRRYMREQSSLERALADNPVYTSAHPQWLLMRLAAAWPAELDAVIAANNSRPPMTLRVNLQRTSRPDYLARLRQANIEAEVTPLSAAGLQLQHPVTVEQLPGFDQGLVSVQDEAAQLAAPLLDLQPGQRVLDACCAPGGKSCHILESQPGIGELLGLDIDPARLDRVRDNLDRSGLSARLLAADATRPDTWWDGIGFDRILLDGPCSATGVIRRHPDIKLLRRDSDIDKLGALQLQLLQALWPTLAPGGKLLYATCSILPEENRTVVTKFIESQVDCQVSSFDGGTGDNQPTAINNVPATGDTVGLQLLPAVNGHDGFFYALLEKQ